MTDKYQNKYRIPTCRVSWHGYDGGMYFITICTAGRKHYFGEIVETPIVETSQCGVSTIANDIANKPYMQLSEIGKFTDDCIHKMETLHNDIVVPLYQIMPNHIHLIVIVNKTNAASPQRVETSQCGVSTMGTMGKNKKMQQIANHCGRLPHIISGLKTAVTRLTRENKIDFAWQTRFYDHIVRDQYELNRIAEYIENNVANWGNDTLNAD